MKKSRLRYLQKERRRRKNKPVRFVQQSRVPYTNPNNVDFDLVFDWIEPEDGSTPYYVFDDKDFGEIRIERICSDEIRIESDYLGGPEHCSSCKAVWNSPRYAGLLKFVLWKLSM